MLNELNFKEWLDVYFRAWETANSKLLASTYAEDAVYNETPFEGKMVGKKEIFNYWEDGANNAQENIVCSCQIITVKDNVGYAKWQAEFDRKSNGAHVKIDGVLEAKFNGELLVTEFNEWWHRKEDG